MSFLSKTLGKVGKWAGNRVGRGPSLKGLVSSVKGTAKLGAKVAPALLIPGVGGLASGLLGGLGGAAAGALSAIPGGSAVLNAGKAIGGLAGKLKSIPGVGALGGYLKDNAGTIMDVVGGVNSAIDAGQARDLEGEALRDVRDDWNARAPLRERGLAGLMSTTAPDLSDVYTSDPGNPYSYREPPAPTTLPAAAPPRLPSAMRSRLGTAQRRLAGVSRRAT